MTVKTESTFFVVILIESAHFALSIKAEIS
jgi:hypothetical protein